MKETPFPDPINSHLTDGMSAAVHISYQVTLVANLMAFGGSCENFRQFGLNIREWRVLGFLGQVGPMTASQIVEAVHQDKGNISRAISELCAKELVIRLPNARHKKSPLIWMTEAGAALYERIVPVFNQQAESFTAVLSENEKTQLCDMLDRLKAHMEVLAN